MQQRIARNIRELRINIFFEYWSYFIVVIKLALYPSITAIDWKLETNRKPMKYCIENNEAINILILEDLAPSDERVVYKL